MRHVPHLASGPHTPTSLAHLPYPAPPTTQMASHFLATVLAAYQESGRMWEKFNAEEVSCSWARLCCHFLFFLCWHSGY